MSLFEAAWVIARRDFIATVCSRSFILFLIVPVILFGAIFMVGLAADRNDRAAGQPTVAVLADSVTAEALMASRARLSAGTSERSFPILRLVPVAENERVQARALLADEEGGYSAVLGGTLDRPVLTGPRKIDASVGNRLQLIIDEARRGLALERAAIAVPEARIERVITAQAAGNLQMIRSAIAQGGQMLIFMVTVLLATLLLSNLAEEKSNKVIEVLAAAVPLDAVFLGKLIAMLGTSLVGLALWGGMLGLGYLFLQALQNWMTMPDVGPAVGWPAFAILLFLYYTANYMLLGALFLGIGGQANNIRDIQTLSMPVTLLQVFVFVLALSANARDGGMVMWIAYLLPFSSPLSMVSLAAQDSRVWPHLLALVWQSIWIVIIIRAAARLFRMTVLKSTPSGRFLNISTLFGRVKSR